MFRLRTKGSREATRRTAQRERWPCGGVPIYGQRTPSDLFFRRSSCANDEKRQTRSKRDALPKCKVENRHAGYTTPFCTNSLSPYESVQSDFVDLVTSVRCCELDGVSNAGLKIADQVVEEGAHLFRLQRAEQNRWPSFAP